MSSLPRTDREAAERSGSGGARVLISSGCDAGYFALIEDLLASLFDHPASRSVDLAIFDLGLTPGQRERLGAYTDLFIEPDWDVEIPDGLKDRPFRRAFTMMPFLPRYIPGYEIYIWLDADTWLQNWFPIEYLIQGADEAGLAIVPELDRNYSRPYNAVRVKVSLGGYMARVRTWSWTRNKRLFGLKTAHSLMFRPLLNSGVLAVRADAPHWEEWEKSFSLARIRRSSDLCDQSMLMHAVYMHGLSCALLPAVCNWTQAGDVAFDPGRRRLVEPNVPHAEIGILHLVGDAARRSFKVPCLGGGSIETSLTYRAMRSQLQVP